MSVFTLPVLMLCLPAPTLHLFKHLTPGISLGFPYALGPAPPPHAMVSF